MLEEVEKLKASIGKGAVSEDEGPRFLEVSKGGTVTMKEVQPEEEDPAMLDREESEEKEEQ